VSSAALAAIAVLVGWLALAHQKSLWDLWFYFGFMGIGALAFGAAALYLGGRHVTVSESALSEKRPFRPPVSIAWSEVHRVTRFERDKAMDVRGASGPAVVTIHDQIDRFADLRQIVLDRVQADCYAEVARRPGIPIEWIVPALLVVLTIVVLFWGSIYAGSVHVTVVDANGAAVPGASVFFSNKEHPQPDEKADRDGTLQRRLPAAPYSLRVSSPKHEVQYLRVEVKPFATEELRVTLQRPVP
jgi:hypothetical protein